MNTIELRNTHLKFDKNSLFRDIYIDGASLQETLKTRYPLEFSQGRFKEEFIPRLHYKSSRTHASDGDSTKSVITPIYGCLDGCCSYLYTEIEYTESVVKWLGVAQDSQYLGAIDDEAEPLIWLTDFTNLVFDKSQYQQVLD